MVAVGREVWRVLRDDGCFFLNIGDSYAGGGNNRGNNSPLFDKQASNRGAIGQCADHAKNMRNMPGLAPKQLCMIPARVALALQQDGWWLRSDIIWSKPNPMPESVTDRPTKSHEYVFLLTKRASYYYDADAIREPAEYGRRDWSDVEANLAAATTANDKRSNHGVRAKASVTGKHPEFGRNRRTVWTVATQPCKLAHFATWPPDLVRPMILAGTSARGCCAVCGAPWRRVVEREQIEQKERKQHPSSIVRLQTGRSHHELGYDGGVPKALHHTLGWSPSCSHDAEPIACTVLDPFAGSGTTGVVCRELGRRFVGLDLSFAYLRDLAAPRIAGTQPALEGLAI